MQRHGIQCLTLARLSRNSSSFGIWNTKGCHWQTFQPCRLANLSSALARRNDFAASGFVARHCRISQRLEILAGREIIGYWGVWSDLLIWRGASENRSEDTFVIGDIEGAVSHTLEVVSNEINSRTTSSRTTNVLPVRPRLRRAV